MSEEKINVLTPGYSFLEGLSKGDKLMFTSMIGGFAAFVAAGLIISSSFTPAAVEGFRINVEGAGGGSSGISGSSAEMMVEDKMWYGGINTFIPDEVLSKESGVGDIYEFVSDDVKTMLAQTAYALKVKGELFSKTYDYGDGYSYSEHWWGYVDEAGGFDYSKPYVLSYSYDNESPSTWSYSVGYVDYGFDYGVIEPFVGEDIVEPEVGLIEPEYRVEEPPKYDEKEAISQVKSFLTILGYSMNDFNLYANTDWGTNVTAEMMLDGQPTPISFNFNFNNDGLESAYGYSGSFVKQGEFGVASPYDAVERINKQGYMSWAASSLYDKYNQSGFGLKDAVVYSEMGEPEGGGVSGFNPDEAVSDDMMVESYPSDERTTEAAGVIVIYREGESPAFTDDMVVVGFENVKGAEFFSLGTQLADNMWSVQFNGVKTFEETQGIISTLESTGVFESVSGDWVISIMPPGGDMMRDNVEVIIAKFETVWVLLYDTEGRMFVTKGYIMTDNDEKHGAHTVSAVDSAVLNIVEHVYVDGIPEPAFK